MAYEDPFADPKYGKSFLTFCSLALCLGLLALAVPNRRHEVDLHDFLRLGAMWAAAWAIFILFLWLPPYLLGGYRRKPQGVPPTTEAKLSLDTLVAQLSSSDAEARERAASALGDLGAGAASALDALRVAQNDQAHRVRVRAAWAVERIEQSPAATSGRSV